MNVIEATQFNSITIDIYDLSHHLQTKSLNPRVLGLVINDDGG